MSSKNSLKGLIILAILASFLFFTIQLAAGKIITPIFGGTAWVWILTMLFFQAVLFAGYILAALIKKRSVSSTLAVLGLFLALSSLLVSSPEKWGQNIESFGIIQVLYLLAVSFGLPGVLLALTTIITQKTAFSSNISPWQLYFYSNIGSIAGIILYPLVIENMFTLSYFIYLWKMLLLFTGFLMTAGSFIFDKKRTFNVLVKSGSKAVKPPYSALFIWVLFSFVPSAFLAVSSAFLSQDIASMPFLWALPLAVFMFAFSLPFAPGEILSEKSGIANFITGILLVLMAYVFMIRDKIILASIVISLLSVFFITWVFVSGLIKRKPAEQYLEYFYIAIAAGGFMGNFFVSIFSPLAFNDFHERWIILILCYLLIFIPSILKKNMLSLFSYSKKILANFIIVSLMMALLAGFRVIKKDIFEYKYSNGEKVDIARSMYGVLNVRDKTLEDDKGNEYNIRFLYNGTIFHGYQVVEEGNLITDKLVEYYDLNTPLPDAYLEVVKSAMEEGEKNVAVIGLGIGNMNFYNIPGLETDYFEIDKNVVEMAQKHFSFLSMEQSSYNIKIGDGRFLLNKEPDGKYSMIIVDAFTGVSVPRHLLTQEAIKLYFQKMEEDGILLIHTSNKYLYVDKILNLSVHAVPGLNCYHFDNGYAQYVIASKKPLTGMKEKIQIYELEKELADKTWTDGFTPLLPFIK